MTTTLPVAPRLPLMDRIYIKRKLFLFKIYYFQGDTIQERKINKNQYTLKKRFSGFSVWCTNTLKKMISCPNLRQVTG